MDFIDIKLRPGEREYRKQITPQKYFVSAEIYMYQDGKRLVRVGLKIFSFRCRQNSKALDAKLSSAHKWADAMVSVMTHYEKKHQEII